MEKKHFYTDFTAWQNANIETLNSRSEKSIWNIILSSTKQLRIPYIYNPKVKEYSIAQYVQSDELPFHQIFLIWYLYHLLKPLTNKICASNGFYKQTLNLP